MDKQLRYDKQCKKVVCNIEVLAIILKFTIKEFNDLSLDEIKRRILDIEKADYVTFKDGIYGSKRTIKAEYGNTIFDVYFPINVPNKNGIDIRQYVDIEIQNEILMNDEMNARIAAYRSAMVESQRNHEFNASNYRLLKKINNIWIFPNADAKMDGKIEKGAITYRNKENETIYDKIETIKIYISLEHDLKDKYEEYDEILTPLHILLTNKYDEATKKRVLKEYGIEMNNELEEEVNTMCNLGEGIYNDGRKAGRNEGIELGVTKGRKEGRKEGRVENSLLMISNLMGSLNIDANKAMEILKISKEDQIQFGLLLKQ